MGTAEKRTRYWLAALIVLFVLLAAPCAQAGGASEAGDGVGSRISLTYENYHYYVDYHNADLYWTQYWGSNFFKYVVYKDGIPIYTSHDASKTEYRASGLSRNSTYDFMVKYYTKSESGEVDSFNSSNIDHVSTQYVEGAPRQDTTWSLEMSPVVLYGNVNTQTAKVRLDIEPGVEVQFYAPEGSFIDRSELRLWGANLDGVIFNKRVIVYVVDDTSIVGCTFKNKADLYIEEGADNVVVDSCLFNNTPIPSSWYEWTKIEGAYDSEGITVKNNLFVNTGLILYCDDSLVTGNRFDVNGTAGSGLTLSFLRVYGDNNRIRNNVVLNRSVESYIDTTGHDNVLSDNTFGIIYLKGDYELYSSNNTITKNTLLHGIIASNDYNEYPINGNTISHNHILGLLEYGGYLRYTGNNATIEGNIIDYGRITMRGDGHVLRDNTVHNNGSSWCAEVSYGNDLLAENNRLFNASSTGITVYNFDGLVIRNNEVGNCSFAGIDVQHATNGTVENNTAHDCVRSSTIGGRGVNIYNCSYVTVQKNEIRDNSDAGIYLANGAYGSYANEHLLIDSNNLTDNAKSTSYSSYGMGGIYVADTNNSTITNNRIVDCGSRYGLYFDRYTGYNTIYNNYINTTKNLYLRGNAAYPDYRWNTTKTAGWNIAGGPYLGGNYWSDYEGYDSDGDLLGDVSYNKTDYSNNTLMEDFLPLIPNPFDLEITKVSSEPLIKGEACTLTATVQTDAEISVSGVEVVLLASGLEVASKSVTVPKNSSVDVELAWDVDWTVYDAMAPFTIEVTVDPADSIRETNETNNNLLIEVPLKRGEKFRGYSSGYMVSDVKLVPYATSVAIWYEGEKTSRLRYNPIATTAGVLVDIENDFYGSQLNAFYTLDNSIKTIGSTSFWSFSPGIVLTKDITECTVQAAPLASYLNWPLVTSDISDAQLTSLIKSLDIHYIFVVSDSTATSNALTTRLKQLALDDFHILLVDTVELGLINGAPPDLFSEVLDAYGDRAGAVVVANTREDSSLAAAPVLAFYRGIMVDARDAVATKISYPGVGRAALFAQNGNINNMVEQIIKGGAHNNIVHSLEYPHVADPALFLVGTEGYLPFWIQPEEVGMVANDVDWDWTASDYPYYHADPQISPGGRLPLDAADNINNAAVGLQLAEMEVGERGGWEDDFLLSGIYSADGMRQWSTYGVWWMESLLYTEKFFDLKDGTVTQLYEEPSAHLGEKSKAWYAFDRSRNKWRFEAPLSYENDPAVLPAGQKWGVNDDFDCVAQETGTTFAELWVDADNDSIVDVGELVYDGKIAGENNGGWTEVIDEEILDGVDNDGDGLVDEDVGHWYYREVDEVYNEHWAEGAASPGQPDLDNYIDLVVDNFKTQLSGKGVLLYSGHGYDRGFALRNLDGWSRATDANGNFYKDNRTAADVYFERLSVPTMAPSTIFASACLTGQTWQAGCISEAFLEKGALSYIGATAIAYGGPSDDLMYTFVTRIAMGDTIGDAYKECIDGLSKGSLWSSRYGSKSPYVNKSIYEFILLGLSAVSVDPAEPDEPVRYGEPSYNESSGLWEVEIAIEFPDPVVCEVNGTVTSVGISGFSTHLLPEGYPALPLERFEFVTPSGGRILGVVLENATLYGTYNISQPIATPTSLWVDPLNMTSPVVEQHGSSGVNNESLGQRTKLPANGSSMISPPEMYAGELFPDVLFLSEVSRDNATNADMLGGSAAAWQVDGSANRTLVYDNLTLRVYYTTPVRLEESHSVEDGRLVVDGFLTSGDGAEHSVSTRLRLQAPCGTLLDLVQGDNVTVGTGRHIVSFDVATELHSFEATMEVLENDQLVAQTSFSYVNPPLALATVNHNVSNVGSPLRLNGSCSQTADRILWYEWGLGDNGTAMGESVSYMYSSYLWNGTQYEPFSVMLAVTDEAMLTNTTTVPVLVYMAGDANGDGVANILDAALVGLHWNAPHASADYHDGADLNNDDVVNILDAAIVGLNWNERA